MTLTEIKQGAGRLALHGSGSAEDLCDLARLVGAVASEVERVEGRMGALGQLVHDRVCVADPALGVKLADWMENTGSETRSTERTKI